MMIKKILSLGFVIFIANVFAQQPYYNDVDLTKSGTALKQELATKIISTHTNILSYSDVWGACKATDVNPDNASEVLLIYGYTSSGKTARTRGINQNGGGSSDWNREHSYPKSLGTPNLGTSGAGADAHHLRPSDVRFNSERGNKKFVSGTGNAGSRSGGWYPGDEWKGDVARMMMYMYLRYGNQCLPKNVAVGSTNSVDSNMINLLLDWNAEDPVSTVEKQRNTYHDSNGNYAQGNRNPFIDNPYLATKIWGGKTAQDLWGGSSSDTEAPTTPTNLAVSNVMGTSVTLSWSASTDNTAVTAYEIFVDDALNAITSDVTFNVGGLTPATFYTFKVRAKDAAGNTSAFSNSVDATTKNNNTGGGGTGTTCVEESFKNIGNSSSSYSTRNWTGDNGFEWTATNARTDQSLGNGKAVTIKGSGELFAAQYNNGISSFKVTTQRVFSGGNGTFDLNVNGTKVGTISYKDTAETVTINNINVSGNVTISITNNSSGSNRVVFDDISWVCYNPSASITKAELTSTSVYPNPVLNGKVTITFPKNAEITNVEVFSVLGKRIYYRKNPIILEDRINIRNLKTGIYLLKISNKTDAITRKIVVK